jgi:hypothetical protein
VTLTEYLVGIAYLSGAFAALGVITVTLRGKLLPAWSGPPARLAELIFALAALVLAMETLGTFGLLAELPLLAVLALAAVAVRWVARFPLAPGSAPPHPSSPKAIAGFVTLVSVALWCGGVSESLGAGIYRQDSTWYHLPFSAGFVQSGGTWSLHFTDPMALSAWFYPQNSELLHSLGMLAFGSDFLSTLFNLCCLGLALLAGWCVGRPFGRAPEALIAVAAVLSTTMMEVQAGNAPNDVLGVSLLLASAALLLNGFAAEGRKPGTGPILVAALAAGLAIGTKITLLAPIGVLTLGLPALLEPERRLRGGTTWLAGLLAGGGYWYLRNALHAANPLPWLTGGPLPGPNQLSLYPRPPHSLGEYLATPSIWGDWLVPMLENAIGPQWPLLLLGALAGLGLALARGPAPQRLLAGAGLAAAVAYILIPVSASGSPGRPSGFETNLRYLAPALVLGLALLALQPVRRRAVARGLAPALAVVFAIGAFTATGWQAAGVMAALALALFLALATFLARRRPLSVPATAAATVLAALAMFVGYALQRDYASNRYDPRLAPALDNPGFRGTPQWRRIQAWANGLHDARIAIVGPPAAFGQYVLYGPDLSNRVTYIGEPGPHGTYRPIVDCASWRRAVNRADPDFLLTTPAAENAPSAIPQETLWTSTDPHATATFHPLPAAVFRLSGPLDPAGCKASHFPPVLRVPGGGVAVPGTSALPGPG